MRLAVHRFITDSCGPAETRWQTHLALHGEVIPIDPRIPRTRRLASEAGYETNPPAQSTPPTRPIHPP